MPAAKLGAGATDPLTLPMPAAGVSADSGSGGSSVCYRCSTDCKPIDSGKDETVVCGCQRPTLSASSAALLLVPGGSRGVQHSCICSLQATKLLYASYQATICKRSSYNM